MRTLTLDVVVTRGGAVESRHRVHAAVVDARRRSSAAAARPVAGHVLALVREAVPGDAARSRPAASIASAGATTSSRSRAPRTAASRSTSRSPSAHARRPRARGGRPRLRPARAARRRAARSVLRELGHRARRACTTTARASTPRCSRARTLAGWPTRRLRARRAPGAAGGASTRSRAGRASRLGRSRAPSTDAAWSVFALPLDAHGARATRGSPTRVARGDEVPARIVHAMRTRPFLVGGTDRFDSVADRGDRRARHREDRRRGRALGRAARRRASASRSRSRTAPRARSIPARAPPARSSSVRSPRRCRRGSRSSCARPRAQHARRGAWAKCAPIDADRVAVTRSTGGDAMTARRTRTARPCRCSTTRRAALVRLAAVIAAADEAAVRVELAGRGARRPTRVGGGAHPAVVPVRRASRARSTRCASGAARRAGARPADDEGAARRPHARTGRARGEATCADGVRPVLRAAARTTSRALHPALDAWMIVEGYGKVLSRPGLDLPRRELCVVAACAAARQDRQLHSHLHGALQRRRDAAAEVGETLRRAAPT